VFTAVRADELIARVALTAEQAAVHLQGNVEAVIGDRVLTAELRALTVDAAMRYSLELALPRAPGLLPGQMLQVRLP